MIVNWKRAAKWAAEPTGAPPSDLLLFTLRKGGEKIKPAGKPPIRVPRGDTRKTIRFVTSQMAKKELRKQLEALCKAIVFTRDCGSPEAREGQCITCGQYRVLQWGHFIRQQDSKWLQYDPRNTGGQCAGCNGPGGRGRVLEYAEAIDKRDGDGSAKALQQEAAAKKFWQPNKSALGEMLRKLRLHPLAPKAEGPGAKRAEQDPTGNTQDTPTKGLTP